MRPLCLNAAFRNPACRTALAFILGVLLMGTSLADTYKWVGGAPAGPADFWLEDNWMSVTNGSVMPPATLVTGVAVSHNLLVDTGTFTISAGSLSLGSSTLTISGSANITSVATITGGNLRMNGGTLLMQTLTALNGTNITTLAGGRLSFVGTPAGVRKIGTSVQINFVSGSQATLEFQATPASTVRITYLSQIKYGGAAIVENTNLYLATFGSGTLLYPPLYYDEQILGAAGTMTDGLDVISNDVIYRRGNDGVMRRLQTLTMPGGGSIGYKKILTNGVIAGITDTEIPLFAKTVAPESLWTWVQTLPAPSGFEFRSPNGCVSVDGSKMAIMGRALASPNHSHALIYLRDGNGQWQFAQSVSLGSIAGIALELRGDLLLCGIANSSAAGVVKVVARNTTTGVWAVETTVLDGGADKNIFDEFGASMVLSGSVAYVGAPRDDDNGSRAGAFYVFQRTGPNAWTRTAKIKPGTGEVGTQLALSGTRLLVGGSNGPPWLYRVDTPTLPTPVGRLLPVTGTMEFDYGENWHAAGRLVVINARVLDLDAVAEPLTVNFAQVESTTRTEGSFTATFDVVLSQPAVSQMIIPYTVSGTAVENQDFTLSSSGTVTIAAGSRTGTITLLPLNDFSPEETETVQLQLAASGAGWIRGARSTVDATIVNVIPVEFFQQRVEPPDGARPSYFYSGDFTLTEYGGYERNAREAKAFGSSIALEGFRAIMGCEGDSGAGSAYIFERDGGGAWNSVARLTADDAVYGDLFGRAVAIAKGSVIIGAPNHAVGGVNGAGGIYVFAKDNFGVWQQQAKLFPQSALLTASAGLGTSLDAVPGVILAGAPGANRAGVFEQQGAGAWAQSQILALPAADAGGTPMFGQSVACTPELMVIGAPGVNVPPGTGGSALTAVGAAYVYEKQGGTWVLTTRLVPSDATDNGYFGWDVAVDGNTVAISSLGAGLYVYERDSAGEWQLTGRFQTDSSRTAAVEGGRLVSGDGGGACHVYTRAASGVWTEEYQVRLLFSDIEYSRATQIVYAGGILMCGSGTGSVQIFEGLPAASDPVRVSFTEKYVVGFEGMQGASFRVQLSKASSQTVVVPLTYSLSTATSGTDYNALPASVTFAPGDTYQFFTITPLKDTAIEASETIVIRMGVPTNAVVGTIGEFTFLIDNDDLSAAVTSSFLATTATAYAFDGPFERITHIANNTIALGQPNLTNGKGQVHLYSKSGSTWSALPILNAPSGNSTGDGFGLAVHFDGTDRLLVAGKQNSSGGAVYVFRKAGSTWATPPPNLIQTITVPGRVNFGRSISADSGLVAIGAPRDLLNTTGPNGTSAAVFCYRWNSTTSTYDLQQTLSPSGPMGNTFGWSVALKGNLLAVSDIRAGTSQEGAVRLYRTANAGLSWAEEATVMSPVAATGALFGYSLASNGEKVAVGRGDQVSILGRMNGVWGILQDAPQGPGIPEYSSAVALNDHRLVTGGDGVGIYLPDEIDRLGFWRYFKHADLQYDLGRSVAQEGNVIVAAYRNGQSDSGQWAVNIYDALDVQYQFLSVGSAVAETGQTVQIQLTLSGPAPAAFTIPLTIGGTAASGQDYTMSATASVALNATSANISVSLLGDNWYEGDETLTVRLQSSATAKLGGRSLHTLVIRDDDVPARAPILTQTGQNTVRIDRNERNGAEVTHFRIADLTGIELRKADGFTVVQKDDWVTVEEAQAIGASGKSGLIFIPLPGATYQSITVVSATGASVQATGFAYSTLTPNAEVGPVSFEFSTGEFIVSEDGREALVEVRKRGGNPFLPGATWSVTVDVLPDVPLSATANDFNAANGLEDYTIPPSEHRVLTFNNNTTRIALPIPINDDAIASELTEKFRVRLVSPTNGAALGSLNTATVTILDNETIPSSQTSITPGAETTSTGSLAVTIIPAVGGQWRLLNDPIWRESEQPLNGIPAGVATIEFSGVPGYLAPASREVTIPGGGTASVTANYVTDSNNSLPRGNLRVDVYDQIGAVLGAGRWRIRGETAWRPGGEVVSGLAPGNYIVEFLYVPNYATPRVRTVVVRADASQTSTSRGDYIQQSDYGQRPAALPVSGVDAYDGDYPWRFLGQIQTAAGTGSGFVVRPHAVLTAAHVIFDDTTLQWRSNAQWFFQRYPGVREPAPQTPRGILAFTAGYGSQYAEQRRVEGTPGQSSVESHHLDVAVLYFQDFAGRGGSGGYVSSNLESNNPYLITPVRNKILAGYPVEGVPNADIGKPHKAGPAAYIFTQKHKKVFTSDGSNAALAVMGFPGNSGGPLLVDAGSGQYYPAAVYVGGTKETLVRAIDNLVADMIERAESIVSGLGELNFTQATSNALETTSSHVIRLTLSKPATATVNLPVTYGGSATRNTDYTGPSTLQVLNGQSEATLTLTMSDDALAEGPETVTIALGSSASGFVTGPSNVHTVSIVDDERNAAAPIVELLGLSTLRLSPPANSAGIGYFRLIEATGVQFFAHDGVTPLRPGDWISVSEAALGIRYVDTGGPRLASFASAFSATADGTGSAVSLSSLDPAVGNVVFQLRSSTFSAGEETGEMVLEVIKSGGTANPADEWTVELQFMPGTATANDFNAGNGQEDFTIPPPASRILRFKNSDIRQRLSVPLLNDTLGGEAGESFTVTLINPTNGATIGTLGSASCVIVDDETNATKLVQTASGALSPTTAQLVGITEPMPLAGSGWRLMGERKWRGAGDILHGLEAGEYEVEFAPVAGYETPLLVKMALVAGQRAAAVGRYQLLGVPESSGSLAVNLSGANGLGQWRRRGQDTWRQGGQVEAGLKVGEHVVEFRPVAGQLEPPPRKVLVTASGTTVSAAYQPINTYGLEPLQALDLTTVNATGPQQWVGRVKTELGDGTGVVVRPHVVLTAASVLFDEVNYRYVNEARWELRSHGDEQRPVSLTPRGWRVYGQGYSREYRAQRLVDGDPELRTLASSEVDAAALFFLRPSTGDDPLLMPGRGGASGYLSENASTNSALVTAGQQRQVLGYAKAAEGTGNDTRLHRFGPRPDYAFTHLGEHVFGTQGFGADRALGGAPVFVLHGNGNWYPAALVLGAMNQNGITSTLVRAIDGGVAHLIEEAEALAISGGNSTGGGLIYAAASASEASSTHGYLRVTMNTPGSGWRLMGASTIFRTGSSIYQERLPAGSFGLEFSGVNGFETPDPLNINIVASQVAIFDLTYDRIPALQAWRQAYGLADGTEFEDTDHDGVKNLLEFAFNLSPLLPDAVELDPIFGEGGLPFVVIQGGGASARLTITYLRRKAGSLPGISYHAEFTSDLNAANWSAGTSLPPVSIDDVWEQVTVEDSQTGGAKRFGRVRVVFGP